MRTRVEIDAEYANAALALGAATYTAFAIRKQMYEAIKQEEEKIDQCNQKMFALNEEAATLLEKPEGENVSKV